MIKACTTCGKDFEPSEPAIKKRNWKCKSCRKISSKKDMENRKDRGLSISGTAMGPEYHKKYQKEYNQRYYVKKKNIESFYKSISSEEGLKKHKCRVKTRLEIKSGKLIKLPCKSCGKNKDIEAHHEDYGNHLDVIWLCKSCHSYLHKAKARGEL